MYSWGSNSNSYNSYNLEDPIPLYYFINVVVGSIQLYSIALWKHGPDLLDPWAVSSLRLLEIMLASLFADDSKQDKLCQVLLGLSSKEAVFQCLKSGIIFYTINKINKNWSLSLADREQLRQLLKQIKEGGCMTQKSGSPLNPKDQLLYVPHTKINQISGLSIIVATYTFFFFF